MADALSLEEMNRMVAVFGASQKNFMRLEQRSSLRSALFDVPRRSSLGWIGIYQHGASLLRQLTAFVAPEEIGRRMKQLCSRPYYLQLSILMCSFFGARQQMILDHGLKPGDPLPEEDDARIEDAIFLVDFWRRVARTYRNDGCLLPAENGYTQAILPQNTVDELGTRIESCTPEHRRSVRRLAATLDLYSFILHGEQRDGTFGHGPYPQPDGTIDVVHEYNDLHNQFLPWAETATRNLYPNLAIVRRLQAEVQTRFDLFGSILYTPTDVDGFVVAESLFTRTDSGTLRQVAWEEIPEIQHRAAEAQNELYVKAAGWTPRYKAEYGIHLFANHFYPFFQIAGLGPSWIETIRRSFEAAVAPLVEPMLQKAEIPSIWPFMATTESDFFWPVTKRHALSPTTLNSLKLMKQPKGTHSSPKTAKAQYYFCGIDIGGTFTDCVVRDNQGRLTIAKALSTPHDSSEGFFNSLSAAAEKMGITLTELLSKTRHLMHGTTLGTNALLERKGTKTGLITTRGHADAIIIMRSVGRSAGLPIHRLHHVSRHQKPDPIVPRNLICEVSERMDWSGEVVLPLNEEETRHAVRHLVDSGVGAIGICFLWGFVNPAHELAVKRIVQEMAPDLYVTCGHELVAKPGEYERITAVAINCFIGPLMSRYLHKIEERARHFGYPRPLVIMQASGGVAGAEDVADRPLFTIGSGPAGGLTACGFLAKQLGHQNVIASDVGGTSFDVGLIHEGQPLSTSQSTINQYTFSVPHLDIESIGSGGGSLIWVDERSGTLKVGPESAGSNPGPVCYGHGGQCPTVTDANLVLGYYDPDYFLGGKLTLDKAAAHAALERVGRELGMSAIEAAAGAIRIVEFQMAELMRQMSVQRGLDPREFVVYSYGGAAGAHAATYARELGVKTVVVPLGSTASTWSALGVQAADLIHVYEKAELMIAPFNVERINEVFSALEKKGRAQLRKNGIAAKDIFLERYVEMKFKLQIHLVEVAIREGKLNARHLTALQDDFVKKYERTHGKGSAFTGAGTEIGLFRVVARGRMERPAVSQYQRQHTAKAAQHRQVYWPQKNGFRNTPVYDAASLKAGQVVKGPAVIQMPETTLVVPPFAHGGFDKYGNIVLTLEN